MELDYYVTQYLIGHGNFAAKLHQLGLKNSPDCRCQQGPDNPEHAIYKCIRNAEPREYLKRALEEEGERWPCDPSVLIKSRKIYNKFRKYARDTLLAKAQAEED